MKTLTVMIALFGSAFVIQALSAQEIPGASAASEEHEFLQKFVGEWEVESEGSGMKGKAVMKSSMLGKLWLVNSSDHEVGGTPLQSIQMIGYDTTKKKYVGIWADSVINYMWHYEGTVDESGKKLTLNAEGPSMSGDGKMTQYKDAYEFKDDDTIIATSSMQNADGEWTVIMKGTAKRRKEK